MTKDTFTFIQKSQAHQVSLSKGAIGGQCQGGWKEDRERDEGVIEHESGRGLGFNP